VDYATEELATTACESVTSHCEITSTQKPSFFRVGWGIDLFGTPYRGKTCEEAGLNTITDEATCEQAAGGNVLPDIYAGAAHPPNEVYAGDDDNWRYSMGCIQRYQKEPSGSQTHGKIYLNTYQPDPNTEMQSSGVLGIHCGCQRKSQDPHATGITGTTGVTGVMYDCSPDWGQNCICSGQPVSVWQACSCKGELQGGR